MHWWNEITKFEQILYIVATASSVVLLVYTVLSMLGLDKNKSDDEFGLFSFRNFLSFLALGSWLSIIFFKPFKQEFVAVLIGAVLAGGVVVAISLISRRSLKKFKTTEVDMSSLPGMTGIVYESIPKLQNGKGRVYLEIGGEIKVFPARTESEKKIHTGKRVSVIEVLPDDMLLVKEIVEEETVKETAKENKEENESS